jgi:hypothetical protein
MEQCTRFSAVNEKHTRGIALSTQTEVEWRPVRGLTNYEVSNHGFVRNVKSGRILRRFIKHKKRGVRPIYQMTLSHLGVSRTVVVHRLVAEAFLPGYDKDFEVGYKDGDATNIHVDNLKMSTRHVRGTRSDRRP